MLKSFIEITTTTSRVKHNWCLAAELAKQPYKMSFVMLTVGLDTTRATFPAVVAAATSSNAR